MKLKDFDFWIRSILDFGDTAPIDASLNGVQVGDLNRDVGKIAFAVDACMDSFIRTRDEGAQLLFVHHGLFWGEVFSLTGQRYKRMSYLINNGIALYACHLPLDQHYELGNNAQIIKALGITDTKPFGEIKGKCIGYMGRLPEAQDLQSIVMTLFGNWDSRINALPFGKKTIDTVAVISGGGTREVSQAIDSGLDLYITGDSSHNIYHECREAGINVLFAGHYLTEVFGVRAVADKVRKKLGLDTVFIDIPTGF